jgi:hypothetical protein
MANGKPGTMVDVMKYFGYPSTGAFRADWSALSETDKTDLKNGVGKLDPDGTPSGSLTY